MYWCCGRLGLSSWVAWNSSHSRIWSAGVKVWKLCGGRQRLIGRRMAAVVGYCEGSGLVCSVFGRRSMGCGGDRLRDGVRLDV